MVATRQERQKLITQIAAKLVPAERYLLNGLGSKTDDQLVEMWNGVKNRVATQPARPGSPPPPSSAPTAQPTLADERQQLADLREQARRAQVKLELVKDHGLKNTAENDAFLDMYFPGLNLTIDNVHSAHKANRFGGLLWHGQPFASIDNQIAADEKRDQQERAAFSNVCRLLTERGINIADSDANFALCFDNLLEFGSFSTGPLMKAIADGRIPGLHGFNQQQTTEIDNQARERLWNEVSDSLQYRDNRGRFNYRNDLEANRIKDLILTGLTYSEVKHRVALCKRIAEAISRDKGMRDAEFGRLLLSTQRPISELETTVAQLNKAKELRALSTDQLRNVIRVGQAAAQPAPAENELPPEYTRRRILSVNNEELKRLLARYGTDAVNRCLDRPDRRK